ncbi:MAG: OmpA family protein [Cytophagales bacterium]|nr:OmpA family protein [Cytophagales bacterium]
MRKVYTLILLLLQFTAFGQDVQWANQVIEYSSQFGKRQYAANQVLGKPNVLPNLGASPNAWSPKKKGKIEYIKVGFEIPTRIQQIAIAETHNPGGIYKIFAYDDKGEEHLLNQFEPNFIPIEGRLFRFFFDKTAFKVKALKITLNGELLTGHFGIDAIGISDSREPISVEINVTNEINNDYVPIALGTNVNSEYNELRPLISPQADILFFSRQNHPENIGGIKDDEDIWLAKRDTVSGDWLKAVNAGRPLNNKGPNFISSISSDGNAMLLLLGNAYYSRNRMTQGVSMSVRNGDGTWSKPKNLDITNDYNLSDKANYFLANDMKTIVMSVKRKDSYGDRDLYAIFLQENGAWSQPLSLGPQINSAAEEGSPFLAKDGKTMFFSSKGFSGYGGYDIYLSRRLDDTWQNWSEPENLGAGFNSREDDIFFNFTENDEYAYYTKGNENNTDIYKVKLPYYQKPDMLASLMGAKYKNPNIIISIRGRVFDSSTSDPIESSIEFIRVMDHEQIELVAADTNGYVTTLQQGFRYQIIAKSDGYYNTIDSLDLRNIDNSVEIVKDLYLDPIIKNEAIVLNNVYFDFDSDVIRSESFPELDKLSEMLLDNPNLHMTIDGHTCSIGTDVYNLDLSGRRAGSIVNYLLSKGVLASHLEHHGYGESRPKLPNSSEPNREINRRVEFELKEIDELNQ